MPATHANDAALIPVSQLHVPDGYETKTHKVDDEILQNSVRLTGIQQPLIVIRVDESSYYVVDGVRRLSVAISLKLSEVPCVIDHGIEDVKDREEYRNRVRFILDEHRQDLLPSQRAKLICQLKRAFNMTTREVGLYLGVTSATISNWTLIEKLIPEIQIAIDGGQLNVHGSRAFAALSVEGQRKVWEEHEAAVVNMSSSRLHKWIRELYPPSDFRDFYALPDQVITHLKRQEVARKVHKRSEVSRDEKSTMLKDFEARKIEIEEKKHQIQSFETEIENAIPVIEALRDRQELWDALPAKVKSDLEEFADRYIA